MEPPATSSYHDDPVVYEESRASLPGAEEIRTQMALDGHNTSSGWSSLKHKKRRLAVVATLLVAAVLALVIAMRGGSSGSRSAADKSDVERMEEAQQFLSFLSDPDALRTVGTPQYQAARWLALQDSMRLSPPASTTYKESFAYFQRYIAALLYYQLNGEDWDLPPALKFLASTSECSWNAGMESDTPIPGSEATSWVMGILCNDNSEIDYIFLPAANLKGSLPEEIGFLLALQHLSLFQNELTGNLPTTVGYLTDLNFLALESNYLTGSVGWIEDPLVNLEYLALGDNLFTGELPSFSKMSSLKEVALDTNAFRGSIENKFNGLTNLKAVFLQDNQLTGEISDDFLADSDVENLDLSDNEISGTFPAHFYRMKIVDLHNNSISGEFPALNSGLLPLKFLSVYNNDMTGGIPNLVGALTQLTHLDVSDNAFTGSIPDSINMLSNLEYLFMADNDFEEGNFPPVWRMTSLVELSLKSTNRIGNIPDWLDTLEDLVLLDLDDNAFTGPIPDSLGSLGELRFLLLNRNQLTGRLPEAMINLENLVVLMADKNDLTHGFAAICEDGSDKLVFFSGDCDSEVNCPCCEMCCSDDDPNCNSAGVIPNLDDTYVRDQYVFSEDLVFTLEQIRS